MKQSEIEQKILEFWRKDNTFQKSVEKDAPKGDFVFYDGPPFATGTPHYGHIVASLIKDMVPRYWTMRGYRVERRWGWDCHGLPIENIVEKEHGFKHKKDILAYGVDRFNEDARGKVTMYVKEWRQVIDRIGRWVDFDNDYKTMDVEFMESVWWVFKQLYDKGLLYEAYRSMHICPRCETTLAQSEVAQGYKEVKDLSVVVKFKVKNSHELQIQYKSTNKNNIYLLAWTTTPWTLPGNAALAVGGDVKYVIVESSGEYYILAKERLDIIFKDKEYKLIKDIKGKDLVDLEYESLFPYYESTFKVYPADFVSTEEGTGIVHIAPAFGTDDYELSKKEKIPFIQHINMDGTLAFGDNNQFPITNNQIADDILRKLPGMRVKHQDEPDTDDHPETEVETVDVLIVKYLAARGLLFSKAKYTHSYPHCWRCDSPLLNYATSSWFVAVEKIKKDLLKNAAKIEWMPEHIKEGRFGQWLSGARDWSISRQRFWGSVLPIWKCIGNQETEFMSLRAKRSNPDNALSGDDRIATVAPQDAGLPRNDRKASCGQIVVIGSIAELEKLSGQKVTDLHKHFVDKIIFPCKKCGGVMKRIEDVLDCWFESGSMPYTQAHFPAQFIAEGVDQTRAWFYYMHILATALKKKPAFQHAVVNGIVLAEDGKKMSKRLQNYPDPMAMFEKYGADAVRYYLASAPVLRAEDFCFSEKGVEEVVKKVLLTLYNVLAFYKLYAPSVSLRAKRSNPNNASDVSLCESDVQRDDKIASVAPQNAGLPRNDNSVYDLDRWIIAKTEELTKDITDAYERYDLNRATRPIAAFINELSTWYLRRSRDRIKYARDLNDYEAITTLRFVLERLTLLMSPVMPFTAEYIWQELGNKESVHLQNWPKAGKIDVKILKDMAEVRKIIEIGLAMRAQAGIKVRQPLASVTIAGIELDAGFEALVMDELNVGEVLYTSGDEMKVVFDTKLTDKLRAQGNLRELVRTINSMRKTAGLTPGDNITLIYQTDSAELKKVFAQYGDELKKSVIAGEIVEGSGEEEVDINGEHARIKIGGN